VEQHPVVISVCGKPGTDATYIEFVEALHKEGFFERFEVAQIALPVHYFRHEIAEHIRDHGLASLFKFSIVMEDITTPGMEVDELEGVIEKFVRSLAGARRLIIVDPYLYGSSKDPASVSSRFGKMIGWLGDELEEIITYTNGQSQGKQQLQLAVTSARSSVSFDDRVQTDLHDRFWIDPDEKRGIVFGTSLNGLGLKLALVDRLSSDDVETILSHLQV